MMQAIYCFASRIWYSACKAGYAEIASQANLHSVALPGENDPANEPRPSSFLRLHPLVKEHPA